MKEQEIKKQIAEILRANIHYSPQLENYVVHGAIEAIWKLMQEYAPVQPTALLHIAPGVATANSNIAMQGDFKKEQVYPMPEIDFKTKIEVELSNIARKRKLDFTIPSEYALGWRDCADYIEKEYAAQLSSKVYPMPPEQIFDIDIELAAIEDIAHGDVGKMITKLRVKLKEYAAQLHPAPSPLQNIKHREK